MGWFGLEQLGGKLLLAFFDKVLLASAIAVTGVLLKAYWDLSQIETNLLRPVPSEINTLATTYFDTLQQIPRAPSSDKKSELAAVTFKTAKEIQTWFVYAESVTGFKCESESGFVVKISGVNQTKLEDLNIREANNLASEFREAYPSAVKCLREHLRKSINIPFLN